MEVRASAWAGVLVPPSNPSVEPELARLVYGALTLYAARFPVMPGTTLEERNRRYVELYRESVRAFGELALSAIVIGLTGPSYRLLPQGDRDLCASLSAIAKTPVVTASVAIADTLAALGARRLCLVSPYPKWLTEEAVGYWRAAGHDVRQVVEISETFRAYELTSDEVASALARVDAASVDAIVLSGTGMLTLPAILEARKTLATPIVSSNLCCAFALLAAARAAAGPSTFAAASPELAQRLARRKREAA